MQPLVTLKAITCSSDNGQIKSDPISLEIDCGDRLMLSGKSGVGKSTLLSLIAGQIKPSSGSISYDPKIIVNTRKDIILVPQFPKVLPFSVAFNVTFCSILNSAQLERLRSIVRLLDLFVSEDISDSFLLDRKLSGLSGGELYRVGLARAFWHKPSLLLLDEPTASLNDELSVSVLNAISSSFHTFLVSSHDELVKSFCKSRYVMFHSNV
jgi:ABC-type transport system involved in cytochrome bd biosynthesis fused ATPase/permease subunit